MLVVKVNSKDGTHKEIKTMRRATRFGKREGSQQQGKKIQFFNPYEQPIALWVARALTGIRTASTLVTATHKILKTTHIPTLAMFGSLVQ